MNLALDASYSVGTHLSGVGVYSRELSRELAAQHPDERFRWYFRPNKFLKRGSLPANASARLLLESLGPRAGLFHGLNQRLPARRFRKQIATFHDLFVLTAEYSTPEFRRRFTEQARHAAADADLIIAVSQFTAGQVQSLLGVEAERIRVIHHGLTASRSGNVRQPENVVLFVGAIQERKNIVRLVDAFRALPPDWRLVLAGSNGYGSERILEKIGQHPRILVTGYVTPEALADWYARAAIFAFPSLDEGFGMPILEAMSAGIPVVTSNRSAMPEVAGNAAILINPESTDEIAHALTRLANCPEERSRLAKAGTGRAQEFSWSRAAAETWNVYRELT